MESQHASIRFILYPLAFILLYPLAFILLKVPFALMLRSHSAAPPLSFIPQPFIL